MPICLITNMFWTDRLCSDMFNTDTFRTRYVTDRYEMSVHLYFNRLETVPFSVFFTREGDIDSGHKDYTGCGNTEHRGLKARVLP